MIRIIISSRLVWLLLMLVCLPAFSEPISGVVFGVAAEEIEILVSSGKMPTAGMVVEVFESSDGAEEISVGTWSVTRLEFNTVFASPVHVSGTPQLGQAARIGNPKPVETPVPVAPPTVAIAPIAAAPVVHQSKLKPPAEVQTPLKTVEALSAADQKLMNDLVSGDPIRIRTAAKYLYRGRYENSLVMDKAAEVLNSSYNNSSRDPMHVDAMAWICKALWVSKETRHIPLLREVGREAKSSKLRSYARKYHAALVRDT